jgi:hypothetical protein
MLSTPTPSRFERWLRRINYSRVHEKNKEGRKEESKTKSHSFLKRSFEGSHAAKRKEVEMMLLTRNFAAGDSCPTVLTPERVEPVCS